MRLPPERKDFLVLLYISDENAEKCRVRTIFFDFFSK